jgi:hypothetical protein
VAAHQAKPLVPDTPAPGVSLDPITDTMSLTLCASPEAGWSQLSAFLEGIQDQLTVGIYDFTSAHVLKAVQSSLGGSQKLSLVLDHPAPNWTADQSDEQTEHALAKRLGKRQSFHPAGADTHPGLHALIEAVRGKIQAGLDVRIILSEYEATGGWLEKLQEAGIEAAKCVRIQHGVHNKGFVVDSKVVALWSQNWSGDGVERNRDASLIIFHEGAAKYFEGIFLHDWETLAKQHLTHEVSGGN